jgi:hypothetical protein
VSIEKEIRSIRCDSHRHLLSLDGHLRKVKSKLGMGGKNGAVINTISLVHHKVKEMFMDLQPGVTLSVIGAGGRALGVSRDTGEMRYCPIALMVSPALRPQVLKPSPTYDYTLVCRLILTPEDILLIQG